MKRFIICLALWSCYSCYTVKRDCENFKTGTYSSEITINGKRYTSKFTRDTQLQVEIFNGVIDSSKVRWINSCEMVFSTINPKNRSQQKDVHLKILTTTENAYTFEYSYVGESLKQKGVATRVY